MNDTPTIYLPPDRNGHWRVESAEEVDERLIEGIKEEEGDDGQAEQETR